MVFVIWCFGVLGFGWFSSARVLFVVLISGFYWFGFCVEVVCGRCLGLWLGIAIALSWV